MSILFTFQADGQVCENVFYVRDVVDSIFAIPTLFATQVLGVANSHLIDGLSPIVSITGCAFEDVRTFPFGGITVGQAPRPGTGGSAGVAIPSSNSIAIKKSTDTLGRSGRGRWYWPLGSSDSLGVTNDTVNPTAIARYINALTLFQSGVQGLPTPVEMGIVSYRSGGALRAEGLFSQIVSWSVTDSTVDSQRRRLTGRGR